MGEDMGERVPWAHGPCVEAERTPPASSVTHVAASQKCDGRGSGSLAGAEPDGEGQGACQGAPGGILSQSMKRGSMLVTGST